MLRLADHIMLASGWTRRLIAFLAGAFGALAMAPLNIVPALIVPMCVAVWLLDGSSTANPRRAGGFFPLPSWGSFKLAFSAGWWLGFGYFVAGFWWLGAACLAVPEFAWALPLAVLGLPAILAFYTAFGFVVARLLWTSGVGRIFALALGLGLLEWARGIFFTGFPWNAFGMALGNVLVTAQLASITGLPGLTFIAIAIFAAPATLADRGLRGMNIWPTVTAVATLSLIIAYGAARLHLPEPKPVPGLIARIMQPGPIPDEKFRPEYRDEILNHYLALSQQDDASKGVALRDVSLLVWPESAFPFILTRDARAMAQIGAILPQKTVLMTGAAREEDLPSRNGDGGETRYFNAIQVLGAGGTLIDSYDKIHLVPFGEYLPFDSILRRLGLRNMISVPGGFEPGLRRRLMTLPGLPSISPLICYEAIFSESILPDGSPRPQLLLNVTNDGWFGETSGPSQHFDQARLRSIEQGLPMIRAAATGISAFIDPYGRVLASLPLGKTGILDSSVSQPISETFYARHPFSAVCSITAAMIFALMLFKEWNRRING